MAGSKKLVEMGNSPSPPIHCERQNLSLDLKLRKPQLRMLGHNNLLALAVMPVQHAQNLVNPRIGIHSHAVIVDNEEEPAIPLHAA